MSVYSHTIYKSLVIYLTKIVHLDVLEIVLKSAGNVSISSILLCIRKVNKQSTFISKFVFNCHICITIPVTMQKQYHHQYSQATGI